MKTPNLKAYIPGPASISREAITVIAGALVAALVIGQFPAVKAWIKERWQ